MSIIQDALRKAEKERALKRSGSCGLGQKKSAIANKIIVGLVFVFGIGMWVIGIMNIFYGNNKEERVLYTQNEIEEVHTSVSSNLDIDQVVLNQKNKSDFYDQENHTTPLRDEKFQQAKVDLLVEGILYDARESLAIVNDKLLRVGDEIQGHTVVSIERDNVFFEKDNSSEQVKVSINR